MENTPHAGRQLLGCHGGLTVHHDTEIPESQFNFVRVLFPKSKGPEHLS